MKITVVCGSHRENSESLKVSRYLTNALDQKENTSSALFSLAGNPLPLWDESIWQGDPGWNEQLAPVKEELGASEGFVIVTPEWHGQVPAGLKNLFLLMGAKELGHKPALIVTVSSGDGGAYPVAELRMSSYKNNRICYIPEQVIVRNVGTVFNDDASKNNESADSYFRARIDWSLDVLLSYAAALRQVRDSGVANHPDFANGM